MANNRKVLDSIKTFLERMKACDESIPEELADDALEMVEGVKDALCEDEEADVLEVTKDKDVDVDIEKKVEDTLVKVLKNHGIIKDNSMKSLDECLEAEVEDKDVIEMEDADGEEDVTVDPESMNDSAAIIRKEIGKIKPIIAGIKNPRDRKRISDAISTIVKMEKGNNYAKILKTSQAARTEDSQKVIVDESSLGSNWAEKFNPHYMKEGK